MNITTAVAVALARGLQDQPWYRRYAGTIVTAAAVIAAFGTTDVLSILHLPAAAEAAVTFVITVAAVLAARATPNGLTPRSNAVAEKAVTEHLGDLAVTARQTAATVANPIEAAQALGWTAYDPRFLGMDAEQSAKAFLDNLTTIRNAFLDKTTDIRPPKGN